MIPRRIGDWEMNPMPDIDQPEQGRTLCWEFLSTGRCPRGSSCGFLHRQRTLAPPPTAPPPTPPLEENTVSSPSLVPGTPNYCDAFPPLQRTTPASTRRRRRFYPASPPRASSPSSLDRDRRDPPPPSPPQTPCSFQRDDTLAAGTSTLTAPVATEPTANIIPTATTATTATDDIRANPSPLDDGIEIMLPGSSSKLPSRDGNPRPTSPPQTPRSSKRDDTIAAGSSNPTTPVTTVRRTGETTPTTADPAANITPSAATTTTTAAAADTKAALNDGIEIALPGSSSAKPPSRGRNPPPPSPPHTFRSSQRDDTVAADPSTSVTTTGETTPTTAGPTANIITPTVTTTTTATVDTRADYSPVDHGMTGWSSNKPPSRDGNPPPPSRPQTPSSSQRDDTVLARTSTPVTPVNTARPTGKTTPANISAPATVTTTATAGTRADYSPLDDGIEIALPGWSSNGPPSREEVNAYIERFLYGPRRPRWKRLPVFEAICPSTPDDYKEDD